jgi:hypothetical protein
MLFIKLHSGTAELPIKLPTPSNASNPWMARAAIVRHLVTEPAADAVANGRRRRGEIEAVRQAVGADNARGLPLRL